MKKEQKAIVTIVILNWNGKHWLEKILPPLLNTRFSPFHILIVDNASTDESVNFIKHMYPQVQIEVLDENYGFAEGNNRALPFIHTPYFVLMNSDIEVEPDWLEPLVRSMEADALIASIQPKILSLANKEKFEHAGAGGGYVDKFFYPFCRGRLFDILEKDQGQYDDSKRVFWASGACSIYRRDIVQQIGLFDGSFFAHMEEIDFCWRAQNLGYKIAYEPKSLVYHFGGGTLEEGSPRKLYLNIRNSLAMMYKNLPGRMHFPKIFMRLILDGILGVKLFFEGKWQHVWMIIRAHFHFYGRLSALQKSRYASYPKVPHEVPQNGFYPKSIVWQHFVRKKKYFEDLPQIE